MIVYKPIEHIPDECRARALWRMMAYRTMDEKHAYCAIPVDTFPDALDAAKILRRELREALRA